MRRVLVLALLGALTAGANAAPLCRAGKGMFTPCPPGVVKAAQARQREEQAREAEDAAKPPSERRKPGLFDTGKLCRDTKGLYTPCGGR